MANVLQFTSTGRSMSTRLDCSIVAGTVLTIAPIACSCLDWVCRLQYIETIILEFHFLCTSFFRGPHYRLQILIDQKVHDSIADAFRVKALHRYDQP